MKKRRQHSALILLLMFVMGSQVAPFSHYMFMLVSDAYHVGAHHHNEHESHHHVDGDLIHSESAVHFECDYWGLFATFSSIASPTADVAPSIESAGILAEASVEIPQIPPHFSYLLRGPPQYTSL